MSLGLLLSAGGAALAAGGLLLAHARLKRRQQSQPALPALTVEQLRGVMQQLPAGTAAEHLPHLRRAMAARGITTPARVAAYVAQIGFESNQLRSMVELASGQAYEGRADLGNTQPGDGPRYKGRGPIQLTGRFNYRAAGRALGLDLEGQPELAARPNVGHRVAAWYWHTRNLNALADVGDFVTITRRINGGLNGLEHREAFYRRARQVFGVPGGVA